MHLIELVVLAQAEQLVPDEGEEEGLSPSEASEDFPGDRTVRHVGGGLKVEVLLVGSDSVEVGEAAQQAGVGAEALRARLHGVLCIRESFIAGRLPRES